MESRKANIQVGRQVRLLVLDNEPLARLWEGRLWEAGIPCIVRPIGVGAAYGSPANVPHALYVREGDLTRAREVLTPEVDLPPLEVLERQRPRPMPLRIVLFLVFAISVAVLVWPLVPGNLPGAGGPWQAYLPVLLALGLGALLPLLLWAWASRR